MDERKLEKASVSLARDEQVSVAELEAKANAEARDEQASVAELEAKANAEALKFRDELVAGALKWGNIDLAGSDEGEPRHWRQRHNVPILGCYGIVGGIAYGWCINKITDSLPFALIWAFMSLNLLQKLLSYWCFPKGTVSAFSEAILPLDNEGASYVKKRTLNTNPVIAIWAPIGHPTRSRLFQYVLDVGFLLCWLPPYLFFASADERSEKLPWALAALVVVMGPWQKGVAFQYTLTLGMFLPWARSVAYQVRSFASRLKGKDEAERLRSAALDKNSEAASQYLDELTGDYATMFRCVEQLSTIWASFFTLAEFTLLLTSGVAMIAILTLITYKDYAGKGSREDDDGEEEEAEEDGQESPSKWMARVLVLMSVGGLYLSFSLVVEVFLVGASVTTAGKAVASSLYDLSLHLPSEASEHVVAVLDRLQAHVAQRPPAFRPHGITIDVAAAVAFFDVAAMLALVASVDGFFEHERRKRR